MTADQTAAVVMEGVLTVSIAFIVNAMLDSKAETVKLVSYIALSWCVSKITVFD